MRRICFVLCAGTFALGGCSSPAEPIVIPGHETEPRTGKVLRLIDLSFTDGAYQIGSELAPGTYRTEGSAMPQFPTCNWKRFRATGQGLIASGSSTGPTTVVIEPTDGAFESRGCRPWARQPMSTATIKVTCDLEVHDCCVCGIHFGVPPRLIAQKRDKGGTFYCPNGHQLGWNETELDRLRKQAERARAAETAAQDQRDAAERSARALRGVITRERRRVANGVSPCCNRSFADLAWHMAGQHPDYVEGGTP